VFHPIAVIRVSNNSTNGLVHAHTTLLMNTLSLKQLMAPMVLSPLAYKKEEAALTRRSSLCLRVEENAYQANGSNGELKGIILP